MYHFDINCLAEYRLLCVLELRRPSWRVFLNIYHGLRSELEINAQSTVITVVFHITQCTLAYHSVLILGGRRPRSLAI